MVLFIPILAAILFPVFAQARESARQVSCLSNEKQQALAILMYSQDYDETLPQKGAWMDVLEPYSRSKEEGGSAPFHCPSVSHTDPSIFGYAYDSRLSARTMDKIQSPRDTMMTFDSTTLGKNATDPGKSMPAEGRHRGRNNASFADGHAAAVVAAGGKPAASAGE